MHCFFYVPLRKKNTIYSCKTPSIWRDTFLLYVFPGNSVDKESACNAGDPGSIPGSGRSPGEGIGYLLQYSWVSLVAQLVKNPPAMRETWVRSLGSIPGLRRSPGGGYGNPLWYSCPENLHGQRSLLAHSPWGSQGVRHDWVTQHSTFPFKCTPTTIQYKWVERFHMTLGHSVQNVVEHEN